MNIVQISDLHCTAGGLDVVPGVDSVAFARRAVDRIRALPDRPDAVIVTGDIADRVEPAEYAAAAAVLADLAMPVHLVPGNHDDRAMIRAAFPSHAYLPGEGRLNYAADLGALRFIGLDSLVDGQIHGTLGAEGLGFLERTLAAAPDRPTIVFLHHPPFETGMPIMDRWRLTDAITLEAIVARHPAVLRVLAGHVHRHVTTNFGGTIAMTAPALCHAIALGPGDEAGNPEYTLETPGFLLHRYDGRRLVTHLVQTGEGATPRRFRA
ncbi:phosphodiesterase [Mongoliimonas terrestris]|uniref:phosphodiesterase n=1 Tax=Mongoliimonas terrestris TaxID=1709001 RepID=UPI000A7477D1|nr:phosphodiesterase [Mongoliimonas terrestris]